MDRKEEEQLDGGEDDLLYVCAYMVAVGSSLLVRMSNRRVRVGRKSQIVESVEVGQGKQKRREENRES